MGKDQDLIEGARNGDYHIVEKILNQRAKKGPLASLRRGPGANAQDSSGFSALHHAAVNRHRDIVELLLSHDASCNIVDLQGSSPLHLASWSGNKEIVRLLLTGPSVPNVNLMNRSLETALHLASQYGHVDVVRLLLDAGADPVITNARQESCLDLASQYGRLETVQLLLDSHPELLAPYTSPSTSRVLFPHTPLNLASRNGHKNVVQVLVKAGFDVNIRTSQGTGLHEAALSGKVDVVRALLNAGIDVCVTDSQRRTAVDRLSEVGLNTPVAKEIAELIRESVKKTHLKSKGNSPVSSPHEISMGGFGKAATLARDSSIQRSFDDSYGSGERRYSPGISAKGSCTLVRDRTRRSTDSRKGPDYEKASAPPPKKPPRRNLSASPTHSGLSDYLGDNNNLDLSLLSQMGRNKSMDEAVYGSRWRYETSQSTDSIDIDYSSLEYGECSDGKGFLNDEMKMKSKSQHLAGDSDDDKFISVAHIRLRDAKSEQNVGVGSELRPLDHSSKNPGELNGGGGASSSSSHAELPNFTPPPPPHQSRPPLNVKDPSPGSGKEKKPQLPPRPKFPPNKPCLGPKPVIAPKPKNTPPLKNTVPLRRPPNVEKSKSRVSDSVDGEENNSTKQHKKRLAPKTSKSMSALSPVDVDKEWEGISAFVDSLSDKMGRIDQLPTLKGWKDRGTTKEIPLNSKTIHNSNNFERKITANSLGKWLAELGLDHYQNLFSANGFDDVEFLGGGIVDENSLLEIGILNAQHRKALVESAQSLTVKWPSSASSLNGKVNIVVEKWLGELGLPQYVSTFRKNLYTDPEKLLSIWNEELITVLEIDKVGHRRRILVSAANVSGGIVSAPRSPSTCSKQRLENGDSEESGASDLPFRDPTDLVSGVSNALKTAWRHTPETLIDGSVTYRAIYVGTSFVHDFSTPATIQMAIQQIRSAQSAKTKGGGHERCVSSSLVNLNVTLIVSATVVSWYNSKTKSLVREHDIGAIQCTCLASDDLRHLALVTRCPDPARNHSCHVFCFQSVELATEVILTLGQAFEVAYQMAVAKRKQGREGKGHTRSKSADQLSTNQLSTIERPYNAKIMSNSSRNSSSSEGSSPPYSANAHNRSQSVIDIPPGVIPPLLPPLTAVMNRPPPEKEPRFPRAQSFSLSCSRSLSRAPMASKEEL